MKRAPIHVVGANLSPQTGLGDYARQMGAAFEDLGCGWDLVDGAGKGGLAAAAALREKSSGGVWLQFVAYGWGKRGVVDRAAARALGEACAGRRTVVNLHELWLGEAVSDGLKNRWLGVWQRRGVLRTLRAVQPVGVITSTPVYQAILAQAGIAAEVWPVPGNLPAPTAEEQRAADAWLRERGLADAAIAVVFGAVHPEWEGASALRSWRDYQARAGREGVLLVLGRNGPEAAGVLVRLAAAVPQLRIESGGMLAAGLLAAVIARAALGLATTPWALIGKSGSAAAYRALGVPVLVTRDDWRWRRGETPMRAEEPGLRRWRENLDWATLLAERAPVTVSTGQLARRVEELLR